MDKGVIMSKIILSADSTCDIGEELQARYQVHLCPLHIIMNGKEYLDGDIQVADIVANYHEHKTLPRTAAINAVEYYQHFKPFIDAGYEIIHISIAGSLSTSYQSCKSLEEKLPGLYVVDSHNLSTGSGLLVVAAGEMIAKGLSAAEIYQELIRLRTCVNASFILDTLEFMQAGGRCSAIAALGASILRIKPCIEVDNHSGKLQVGKRYRGSLQNILPKYALDRLQQAKSLRKEHLFITHALGYEEDIRCVQEAVQKEFAFKEVHITTACCTIASHCGPRTLGVLFLED